MASLWNTPTMYGMASSTSREREAFKHVTTVYQCSTIYKNVWNGVLVNHTDRVGDGVPDIPWTRSVQTRCQIYKCSFIYKNVWDGFLAKHTDHVGDGVLVNHTDRVGDGVPDIPWTRSVQTRYHRLSMFTHIWKCRGWRFCETHRPCRGWRPRHPVNAKRSNTSSQIYKCSFIYKNVWDASLRNTPTM